MNQTISNSNSNSISPNTFEPMLKESINQFLTEYRKGVTDFSNFTSIFSRLLQILPDPPLEIVWFYSSLTFHTTKFTVQQNQNQNQNQNHPSIQISLVKDLFQLLLSCSTSCNVVKKIAILAPVIYELCHLVFDKKVLKRDIESLLEGIISYISICCSLEEPEEELELLGLNSCFVDLIRVWMVDKIGENCGFGEELRLFLPIVSDKVRNEVYEQCSVKYLAGVVMCEAFLLRLCLKFGLGVSRVEMEKDMHDCAVQMITGFRSFYFIDTLLRMLLEPVLPVASQLYFVLLPGSEDEVLLREVLYDAVLAVKFSFLNHQRGIHLPGNDLKNLAVKWLFVADNAIRFVRENGNQTKIISYMTAFSESCLPSQLIEWVTIQTGNMGKTIGPKVSTPISLIKWLLIVEDQGVRVFESDVSKIYAKALICKSREQYELPVYKPDGKNLGENLCFYTNNEERGEDKVDGNLEMVDSMDTVFLKTPALVKSTAANGTRKRKEGRKDEGEAQVKFVKYQLHERENFTFG